MEELKNIDDSSSNSKSTSTPTLVSPTLAKLPRGHRAKAAARQPRKLDEGDTQSSAESRLLSEARRREKQIAQEEMKRMHEEQQKRDLEYKNRVRDEIRTKEERERQVKEQEAREAREARAAAREAVIEAKMQAQKEAKEARERQIREAPLPRADMPFTDYETIFAAMRPKAVSETVKEEIESIQASHTSSSSPSPQSNVESLIAARVQNMRERAGDYSRFLPSRLGVDRSPGGSLGPAAYAELVLSRVRGAGLSKRREAVRVVERLVKTITEERPEP